jgi:hypothetical protein
MTRCREGVGVSPRPPGGTRWRARGGAGGRRRR